MGKEKNDGLEMRGNGREEKKSKEKQLRRKEDEMECKRR